MKKFAPLFLFALIATSVQMRAQIVAIPDSNFKNVLLNDTLINVNKDSEIQLTEAQTVTHLNVSNKAIQDLTGVRDFTTLSYLNCSNNQLTELDVSGNVELDTLQCEINSLTSVCINGKQLQHASEFSLNWIKDINCEWSRINCSVENDSCFALFYTTSYDTAAGLFTVLVDSLTTADGISFRWMFGDGTFIVSRNPKHFYPDNAKYNLCMRVYTAVGDSCEYCHMFGLNTIGFGVNAVENVYRHSSTGFLIQVLQFGDVVGVDKIEPKGSSYLIAPNPTSGLVNVKFNDYVNNADIKIINLSGQKIIEQTNLYGKSFSLDITNQAAGMYIVETIQNGVVSRSKLFKN